MAPPRVELFAPLHKVLRCMLADSARTLGNTDFVDDADTRSALAFVRERLAFLREHAGHEDTFIIPELRKRAPAVLEQMTSAHVEHEHDIAALETALAEIESASGLARVGRAVAAYGQMNRFIAHYLLHLDHEETVIQGALWEHFTDEELVALRGRLQGSIPPPRFAEWLRHWLPVLHVTEIAGMLSGMKAAAPPEAFARIADLARSVLGEDRWSRVATRAGLG